METIVQSIAEDIKVKVFIQRGATLESGLTVA